jgi:hypothetical protein
MVDIYAYKDTANTYIYGCSNNVYVDGLIGIHVLSQSSSTATPSTVLNLLLGQDGGSDYNNCFGVYGAFKSGSHTVNAVLKVSTEPNPLLMILTITGASYTITYKQGVYASCMNSVNSARFIWERSYFVGTAYSPFSDPSTFFDQPSGFMDTFDATISCSSSQTYSGTAPTELVLSAFNTFAVTFSNQGAVSSISEDVFAIPSPDPSLADIPDVS